MSIREELRESARAWSPWRGKQLTALGAHVANAFLGLFESAYDAEPAHQRWFLLFVAEAL